MEDVDNSAKNTKPGFINHVFNFDTETKNDLLNIGQYLLLALVPMALYNHLVDSLIPEPDESKGNLEILAEVVGQFALVLSGIFLIHRLITYVPTYSGRAYGTMNLFSIILIFIVLAYESHTKVGEKMKILIERLKELWEGKKEDDKKKKKDPSVVKVSQPISRAGMPTQHAPSRADYLKSHDVMNSPTQMLPPAASQDIPQTNSGASNNIYNSGGFNGLVDANSPMASPEPMAANEGFGAFSSW
tara:strand:+ start:3963 stop:4697 length:735 start_codon:yes stop_codon:yes gene_type:complete